MLKTIKTTGELNLHELIKYAWENGLENKTFRSSNGIDVKFHSGGNFNIEYNCAILADSIFTVEIEEPIKDVTLLKEVVYVYESESLIKDYDTSIDEILNHHHKGNVSEIHALINGKLELVWERDEE